MRRVVVFCLFLLLVTPSHANMLSRCWYSAMGYPTERLERGLLAAGYAAPNAARIAFQYPGVAKQILQMQAAGKSDKWKPVTIYRGMRKPWRRFDPNYRSRNFPDEIDFSYDVDTAVGYAARNERLRETTVVEVQIPYFLLHHEFRVVVDEDVPYLNTWQIRDYTPFITRVGTLNPQDNRNEWGNRRRPPVTWRDYTDLPPPR